MDATKTCQASARPHLSSRAFCSNRKEHCTAGGQHEVCDNQGSAGGSWEADWKLPALRPFLGTCPERGRENQTSISIKRGVEGDSTGSLCHSTFFLGSGGGLTGIFGGLAMQLVCSSLMAMMVEEWTMVRWGVRPRCRQLRIYCRERPESAWMKQSPAGKSSQANQSWLKQKRVEGVRKGHSNNQNSVSNYLLLLYKPAAH